MKFRVTPAAVIVSILIVAVMAFLVVILSLDVAESDVLNRYIEALELPDSISVSFSSMDRLFLRKLVFNDVNIALDKETIFRIKNLEISASLQALITHLITGEEIYDVRFENPDITINKSQIEKILEIVKNLSATEEEIVDDKTTMIDLDSIDSNPFEAYKRAPIPTVVSEKKPSTLVKRTGLRIWLTDASASIDYEDYNLILSKIDCAVSLRPGLEFLSSNLNISNLDASIKGEKLNVKELRLALDEDMNLSLSFDDASVAMGSIKGGYVQLSARSLVDNYLLNIENPSGSDIRAFANSASVNISDFDIDATSLDVGVAFNPGTLGLDANLSLLSGSVVNQAISTELSELKIKADGNINSSIDYEIDVSRLDGSENSLDIKASASVLSLSGNYDFNLKRASGVMLLKNSSVSEIPAYMIDDSSLSETALNYYISPTTIKGDVSSEIKGKISNDLVGDFEGSLVSDFFYQGKEDFLVNAQIENLSISTLPDPCFVNASVSSGSDILSNVTFNLGEHAWGNVIVDLSNMTGDINLRLEGLTPKHYSFFYDKYVSFLDQFVTDETNLDLYLNLELDDLDFENLDLKSNFELAVRKINIGEDKYNFSVSFNGLIDEGSLSVNRLIVATDEYRVDYDGKIKSDFLKIRTSNLGSLPEGTLTLKKTLDASELGSFQLASVDEDQYSFLLMINEFADFSYSGVINLNEDNDFDLNTVLAFGEISYPIDFDLDFNNLMFKATTAGAEIDVGYLDRRLSVSGILNDFALKLDNGKTWTLNLDLNGFYRTDSELYNLQANNFSISGSDYNTVAFNLHFDPQSLLLDNMIIGNDESNLFRGRIDIQYSDILNFTKGIDPDLSVIVDFESTQFERVKCVYVDGLLSLDIRDFQLYHLGSSGVLSFSTLSNIKKAGYGELKLTRDNGTLSCDVILTPESFKMLNLKSSIEGLELKDSNILFDRKSEHLIASLYPIITRDFTQGVKHYQLDAVVDADLTPLVKSVSDLVVMIKESPLMVLDYKLVLDDFLNNLSGVVSLNKFSVGDISFLTDTLNLDFKDSVLNVAGNYINLTLNPKLKTINAKIDETWGVGLSMNGSYLLSNLDLKIDSFSFPLLMINSLIDNSTVPIMGGIVTGNLIITGSIDQPQLFGTVYADEVSVGVFWCPDTEFTVRNAIGTLHGLEGNSPKQRLEVYNTKTHQRGYGLFSAWISLTDGFKYNLDIDLENSTMPLWVPVSSIGLDVTADIGGRTQIGHDSGVDYLKGDITISNMVCDFNLSDKNIPQWYLDKSPSPTDYVFDITFLENNVFYYPNLDNPILNLSLNENDKLSVSFVNPNNEFFISGGVSLRSGQIYYFQKDFLVTEGRISFIEDSLHSNTLSLSLDLTAKMRDYDSSGNKVDIYLNLQNSSLDEFQPYFTSVPSLPENEILQLLGQNILPTAAFQSPTLSSIASLTVATAQALGKVGILQTGQLNLGLNKIVSDSLGLDIFTIRSNLLQNIVIDALPGSIFSSDLSPMAKYLDGTSIYGGKYISDSLFLQGTLALKASNANSVGSFLTNDLRLDLELSLEWENPLATFSFFTQPQELSVFNLFDTIGFSVTKSIQF